VLDTIEKDRSPTLKMIATGGKTSNLAIGRLGCRSRTGQCKLGRRFDDSVHDKVSRLLERRSGPIGAAIAISIALPND